MAPTPSDFTKLSYASFALAALTASGGAMGYARTGSLPSIMAGGLVGALYGFGGYRIQNRQSYGIELSLLASLILGASSFPRAMRLRKPVPIFLSVLSAYGILVFGGAFRKTM